MPAAFTLDPKTQLGWKWKDGKCYSMRIGNQRAGAAIPTPGKVNFKSKRVIRGKEGYYILIKSLRQQKQHIIVVNIYTIAGYQNA